MAKECVLYGGECKECGECEMCDLDTNKKCNNCGECINETEDFRSINVEEFIKERKKEDKGKN